MESFRLHPVAPPTTSGFEPPTPEATAYAQPAHDSYTADTTSAVINDFYEGLGSFLAQSSLNMEPSPAVIDDSYAESASSLAKSSERIDKTQSLAASSRKLSEGQATTKTTTAKRKRPPLSEDEANTDPTKRKKMNLSLPLTNYWESTSQQREEQDETDLGEYDLVEEEDSELEGPTATASSTSGRRQNGRPTKYNYTTRHNTRNENIKAWRAILSQFNKAEYSELNLDQATVTNFGCLKKKVWFVGNSTNARYLIDTPIRNWSSTTLPVERLQRMVERGDFAISREPVERGSYDISSLQPSDEDLDGQHEAQCGRSRKKNKTILARNDKGSVQKQKDDATTQRRRDRTMRLSKLVAEFIENRYPNLGPIHAVDITKSGTSNGAIRFTAHDEASKQLLERPPSHWYLTTITAEGIQTMLDTGKLGLVRTGASQKAESCIGMKNSSAETHALEGQEAPKGWKQRRAVAVRKLRNTLARFMQTKYPDTAIDPEIVSSRGCIPMCVFLAANSIKAQALIDKKISDWHQNITPEEIQAMIDGGEFTVYKEDNMSQRDKMTAASIIYFVEVRRRGKTGDHNRPPGNTTEHSLAARGSNRRRELYGGETPDITDVLRKHIEEDYPNTDIDPHLISSTGYPSLGIQFFPTNEIHHLLSTPLKDWNITEQELRDILMRGDIKAVMSAGPPNPASSTMGPPSTFLTETALQKMIESPESSHVVELAAPLMSIVDSSKPGNDWAADVRKIFEDRKKEIEKRKEANEQKQDEVFREKAEVEKKQEEVIKEKAEIEKEEAQLSGFFQDVMGNY